MVSKETEERIIGAFGAVGHTWLRGLAGSVATAIEHYRLEPGPATPASYGYVEYVTGPDGEALVLKSSPPSPGFRSEIAALRVWNGACAPRVVACDFEAGIVLLERVLPGRPLVEHDEDGATAVVARLALRIAERSPKEPLFRPFVRVADLAVSFGRVRRLQDVRAPLIPAVLLDRAEETFLALVATSAPPVLLHGDLHHWNILAAGDGAWSAIDPKGYLGEPAYEFGAFLRNPAGQLHLRRDLRRFQARRVAELSELASIDARRIRDWAFSQAVLSACWSIEDREGPGAALACAESLMA